jgi:hypothetical protein
MAIDPFISLVPAIGYFLVVTNAGTLLRPQAFTYNQLDLSCLILTILILSIAILKTLTSISLAYLTFRRK